MKTTNLLSIISAALVAFSQPVWAGGGGFGGGGGFHGGGFGGGFRGGGLGAGGFRGGALPAQPVGGGAMSRGGGVGFGSPRFGGVRPAPYTYRPTHFAGRNVGGPTGAFRYYNGGTRTSAARTYQFSGRENQSMRSHAGTNTPVARQQNRPASPTRQNMRTSNAQSSAAVRKAMANHRVFARHDGNWHRDWDKHHTHFDHGHVFVFTDGFWWGLYPWDYYPDYGYSDYPYDNSYDYPYDSTGYPDDGAEYSPSQPYSYYNGYAPSGQYSNTVVSAVQSKLANLGYYHGAIDGNLGDESEAALARYQQDQDLSVTGTVTSATLQALGLPYSGGL